MTGLRANVLNGHGRTSEETTTTTKAESARVWRRIVPVVYGFRNGDIVSKTICRRNENTYLGGTLSSNRKEPRQRRRRRASRVVYAYRRVYFVSKRKHCNDPSAGSPTETLLRLLLPLNDQVWSSSQRHRRRRNATATSPKTSLNHSIGSSDGRCVQRAGT